MVFKNNNIDLSYEYAVAKENDTELFKSSNFDLSKEPKTYQKLLFPDDELAEDILDDNLLFLFISPIPMRVLNRFRQSLLLQLY
jgi:hypothetical protein